MVTKKNFGIIGGDFRQIYLAKKFHGHNNKVFLYGFDKQETLTEFSSTKNIHELIEQSNYIILPVPSTRDGIHINAPLSKNPITFDQQILDSLHNKIIFGDLTQFTNNISEYTVYNYSKIEDFQIINAIPTAEGALKVALDLKKQTIFKSNCLITGFGRVGKILANRLEKFGSSITIASRNSTDLSWACSLGYNYVSLPNMIENIQSYDLIFNTIPHVIFDSKILSKCNENTLIIDLASAPGGIDKDTARKLNINFTHELGIPGRMFPKTAADIIYYSIKKIIEERIL